MTQVQWVLLPLLLPLLVGTTLLMLTIAKLWKEHVSRRLQATSSCCTTDQRYTSPCAISCTCNEKYKDSTVSRAKFFKTANVDNRLLKENHINPSDSAVRRKSSFVHTQLPIDSKKISKLPELHHKNLHKSAASTSMQSKSMHSINQDNKIIPKDFLSQNPSVSNEKHNSGKEKSESYSNTELSPNKKQEKTVDSCLRNEICGHFSKVKIVGRPQPNKAIRETSKFPQVIISPSSDVSKLTKQPLFAERNKESRNTDGKISMDCNAGLTPQNKSNTDAKLQSHFSNASSLPGDGLNSGESVKSFRAGPSNSADNTSNVCCQVVQLDSRHPSSHSKGSRKLCKYSVSPASWPPLQQNVTCRRPAQTAARMGVIALLYMLPAVSLVRLKLNFLKLMLNT